MRPRRHGAAVPAYVVYTAVLQNRPFSPLIRQSVVLSDLLNENMRGIGRPLIASALGLLDVVTTRSCRAHEPHPARRVLPRHRTHDLVSDGRRDLGRPRPLLRLLQPRAQPPGLPPAWLHTRPGAPRSPRRQELSPATLTLIWKGGALRTTRGRVTAPRNRVSKNYSTCTQRSIAILCCSPDQVVPGRIRGPPSRYMKRHVSARNITSLKHATGFRVSR